MVAQAEQKPKLSRPKPQAATEDGGSTPPGSIHLVFDDLFFGRRKDRGNP